jgi:hypothetical protein
MKTKKQSKKNSNVVKLPVPFAKLKLNMKERTVFNECARALLAGVGQRGAYTLDALAQGFAWVAKTKKQANSWARNAVRRPLRERLIKRVSSGTYAITPRGLAYADWCEHHTAQLVEGVKQLAVEAKRERSAKKGA